MLRINWAVKWVYPGLALLIIAASNAPVFARVELRSPFKVEVRLTRDVYAVGEPLAGEVLITNTYPASIPAAFTVRTFHDDKETSSHLTAFKGIPLGTIKFSLQHFGIPPVTAGPDAVGSWRITIAPQNHEPTESGQADFKVVPRK